MTEITKHIDELAPSIRRFVLQWGDMGTQWGVNRTVAQIHALLYISEQPLHAEQIAETLGIARSNVSNSLKELMGWRIIERVPIAGDRRDHFTAETDVWEMTMRIAAVRKEREIDPALRTIDQCLREAEGDETISAEQLKRLEAMHDFTHTLNRWYGQMIKVPSGVLLKMIRMGDKIVAVAGFGRRKDKTE